MMVATIRDSVGRRATGTAYGSGALGVGASDVAGAESASAAHRLTSAGSKDIAHDVLPLGWLKRDKPRELAGRVGRNLYLDEDEASLRPCGRGPAAWHRLCGSSALAQGREESLSP